jgi:hypothetical protein
MSAETVIKDTATPPLSYWSAEELDLAVSGEVLFLIPSHMGGSFYATLKSYDLHTGIGTFEIDHKQAGDFHGKTALEGLQAVKRVAGSVPEFLSDATHIGAQNDAFRTSLGAVCGIPGQVVFTHGIEAKGSVFAKQAIKAVQTFAAFDDGNNPRRERDFGIVRIDGETVYFKIDLYDADYRYGTPEPANPAVTRRVLTVLLASEY